LVSLLADLGKQPKLVYDADQDTDVIISYRTDLEHGAGDGVGLRLCEGVARVLSDAGHTPFHGHMVPAGNNWQKIWFSEMPMATVAIVMFSPAFFQSDACVRQLSKICEKRGLQDRIIPIFIGPVDIESNFLGTKKSQIKEARFIRATISGNSLPDPRYGLFQDNWSANTTELLRRVEEFKST
jgi:hypothetical protein